MINFDTNTHLNAYTFGTNQSLKYPVSIYERQLIVLQSIVILKCWNYIYNIEYIQILRQVWKEKIYAPKYAGMLVHNLSTLNPIVTDQDLLLHVKLTDQATFIHLFQLIIITYRHFYALLHIYHYISKTHLFSSYIKPRDKRI